MEKLKFTVLTEPVGFYYNNKTIVKKIVGRDHGYGGHRAVTRSLINGLNKIENIEYNYRPHSVRDIYQNVHVLAGVKTLKYAIELKRKGIIKHLTAGPNIVTFSTDSDGIIHEKEVELYLQPSQWAADLHIKMATDLDGRCVPWPAGIDISKYNYNNKYKKNNVIIYHKDESDQFCYRLQHEVKKFGYNPIVIKYGSYKLDDYIEALSKSSFMISLSRQESQGIFLTEAWAMDVPTICFDPHFYHWPYDYIDVSVEGNISTCPYLTDSTGIRFETFEELHSILCNWEKLSIGMQPRKWVEENMTDEVCARKFVDIMRSIYQR